MTEVYILEWTFTPPDYFEEAIDFVCEHGVIHVDTGKAEFRVPSDRYPTDHSLRNQIHAELDARFLAAQILAHTPYTLSKSSVSKLYPDGRKDAWAFLEGVSAKGSCGNLDIVIKDSTGNITRDTRRERIDHRAKLAQLAAFYINDPVANAILRSYSAAVNDSRNELVHLYEIRDALSRHFRGQAAATTALGISNAQWSRLGQLANNEPFTQGRHRGQQIGALRDAAVSELSEAREIARSFIEGYLSHLKPEHRGQALKTRT